MDRHLCQGNCTEYVFKIGCRCFVVAHIILEGFYFHGFEVIVLSERLEYSGYAEGYFVPKGECSGLKAEYPRKYMGILDLMILI